MTPVVPWGGSIEEQQLSHYITCFINKKWLVSRIPNVPKGMLLVVSSHHCRQMSDNTGCTLVCHNCCLFLQSILGEEYLIKLCSCFKDSFCDVMMLTTSFSFMEQDFNDSNRRYISLMTLNLLLLSFKIFCVPFSLFSYFILIIDSLSVFWSCFGADVSLCKEKSSRHAKANGNFDFFPLEDIITKAKILCVHH